VFWTLFRSIVYGKYSVRKHDQPSLELSTPQSQERGALNTRDFISRAAGGAPVVARALCAARPPPARPGARGGPRGAR
jgi:hypothetical protein